MMPAARRSFARAACALALLAASWSMPTLYAQSTTPEILGVRVGFGGRYKVGYWAPVNLEVRGGAQSSALRLQLELPDGEGEPTRLFYADAASPTSGKDLQQRTFSVAAGQTLPLPTIAKFGKLDGTLQATLFDGETPVASRKFETDEAPDGQGLRTPLLSTQELVVNLGPSAGVEPQRSESGREGVVVDLESIEELPSNWLGYDGVDWLVITTSKPDLFGDLDSLDVRLAALEQWVRLGGRLILSVGSGADDVLAPNAPLARFAPGKLRSTARLPSNAGIETFAGSREPLTWAGGDQRPPVAILENVRGNIEAYEGAQPEERPLVIRAPFGLGQVVFVAFDLDLLARSQWAGRRSFMTRLLERSVAQEGRRGRNQDNDLSATLRTGLDEFRGVKPVSFAVVAVLIGFYLLAIGPFDYYVVRKLLNKPELTWLTFPAYVAIFCGLAWGLAYRFKGDQLRMNQVDLIDVDLESRLVRGTSWANLFSPRAESFDFDLQPKTPVAGASNGAGAVLSWLGAPGSSVGGMDARGGAGLFHRPYEIWPGPGRVADLPIQVWSSRAIIGRWSRGLPAGPTSQLTETGSRTSRLLLGIEGTIDNPFGVPLEECVVLYGDFAYVIGSLTPGQQVRINRDTRWQTVKSYFGTTAQVGFQAEAKAWDADTTDPIEALRVMMFYQAIDGYRYTQRMLNAYQRFVDLSSSLAGGQAVFVGYGPLDQSAVALAPADSVLSRADNQARAVYRIVAPVTRSAAAPTP